MHSRQPPRYTQTAKDRDHKTNDDSVSSAKNRNLEKPMPAEHSLCIYTQVANNFEKNENVVTRGIANWCTGYEAKKCRQAISDVGFWFVDIPRTGSTSIKTVLGQEIGYPYGKDYAKKEANRWLCESSSLLRDHSPSWWVKKVVGEECWKELETFTIIRNPLEWICSINAYYNKECVRVGQNTITIEQHLEHLLCPEHRNQPLYSGRETQKTYWSPYNVTQADMIMEAGTAQVKHLLCFDDLKNILNKTLPGITGIKPGALASIHREKSTRKPVLKQSEIKLCEEYLRDDFRLYELAKSFSG